VTERSADRIRAHYEIERALADRLRAATRQERRLLYSALYDELFRRVPDHPLLTRSSSPLEAQQVLRTQVKFLRRFIKSTVTFLEVGAGDCALSLEVAKSVRQVHAVDVSGEIAKTSATPQNFTLSLSDGCSVPVADGSVDVAYSNQLMEHLHPEDAFEQLENIYRVLAPHGVYLCVTPSRLTGPHDVSSHFDTAATGFHLREYTISELVALFRQVGFSRVCAYVGAKGYYARCPVGPLMFCETVLGAMPERARNLIAHSLLFRMLLNVRLGAFKGHDSPD